MADAAAGTTWTSAGGVHLALPPGWSEVAAGEHLAVLVGERDGAEVMAPTCIVGEDPGHPDPLDWWAVLHTSASAPLLLALIEEEHGFRATYAAVFGPLSFTAHLRLLRLPGRNLSVTLLFDSASTARRLPLAREIVDSVRVEGLP